MVGWGYPPNIEGGLDIHVAKLFDELRKKEGVSITLVLPSKKAPSDNRENIITIDVESDNVFDISKEMSQKIPKIAQEYDIVHTHDWFGAETGFKCKKYSEVTWVSTIHSLNKNRSRKISEDINKLEKVACTEANYLITVSELLKEDINEEHNISAQVIYNGFSKPKSKDVDIKKHLGIEGDMIFFVGRHAEQKGIEHLIYGFKKYLENDNNAYLVLGGEGHLREAYEDFVNLLGIENNVIFTGFLEDEILGDYYDSADVFISPSVSEPFGLTITEALEMKTPVIATKSGVKEILPQNLVFDAEPDSTSIKGALEKVLGSQEKHDFDFTHRSWEEMATETHELYKNI